VPPFLRDSPESVAHLDRDKLQAELDQAVREGDRRAEMRLSGLLGEASSDRRGRKVYGRASSGPGS
jgi:hypothetical protein